MLYKKIKNVDAKEGSKSNFIKVTGCLHVKELVIVDGAPTT